MSKYYNPNKTKNLYDPQSDKPFKISRSKIELFTKCPRCFYLDLKLGVSQPPGFPFSLNSAVDSLLKQEFDLYRVSGKKHPLIEKYKIDATPISHESLDQWRHTFTGIQYLDKKNNFLLYGAIDDLWQNSSGEFIVVDYKATSKDEDITELNKDWHDGYKRQMEIYQWLLRQNGLKVCSTGYFVYCNGKTDRGMFDARLEFDINLIPYVGDDSWIPKVISDIKKCLDGDQIPDSGLDCDYCAYVKSVSAKLSD